MPVGCCEWCEQPGEGRGVFECLVAALPEVGRHRVGGIAEEDEPAAHKARQSPGELLDRQVADDGRIGGGDEAGDRVVPVGEDRSGCLPVCGEALAGRGADDAEPVHAAITERGETEARVDIPGLTSLTVQIDRLLRDPAPGSVAGVADSGIGRPCGAHGAAQTVGADDDIEALTLRASGAQCPVGGAAGDASAGAHCARCQCGSKHRVQVRAVDDAQLGNGIHRVDSDPAAVRTALPAGELCGLRSADRAEVLPEPKRIKRSQPIAEDRQARTTRAQVSGLLEYSDLGTGAL